MLPRCPAAFTRGDKAQFLAFLPNKKNKPYVAFVYERDSVPGFRTIWMSRAIVWMLRATIWMLRAIMGMLRATSAP
eukprot:5425359-Pyramimonas_sp.AAC.1